MKKKIALFSMLLLVLAVVPASAHYVYLDPVGELTAQTGEEITLNVYAVATEDDAISFFQFNVGFDDAALGGELTYVGNALNLTDFAANSGFFPGAYIEGGSITVDGASQINTIGAEGPAFTSVEMSAGDEIWLASITFTYTNAAYSWTGDDVWIEFDGYWADAVYWDNYLDGVIEIGANGADFAAVPVPAAVWLLGSGLVGMIGLRRRNR